MSYQPSHYPAAPASHRPPLDAADFDGFLIDEEFDELLDREIASLRETLADSRCF
jgi:hypothetical protein